MQFCFKQETGTNVALQHCAQSQSMGIQAVWLYISLYNCILVQLPNENQTLSGVREDIHNQHPFMVSL